MDTIPPVTIERIPRVRELHRDGRIWRYTNDIHLRSFQVDVDAESYGHPVHVLVEKNNGGMRIDVWLLDGHEVLATLFDRGIALRPYRFEVYGQHIEWRSGQSHAETWFPHQLSNVLGNIQVRPWAEEYDGIVLGVPIGGKLQHGDWKIEIVTNGFFGHCATCVLTGPARKPYKFLNAVELYLSALAGHDVAIPWLGERKPTRWTDKYIWDETNPICARTRRKPRRRTNRKMEKGLLAFGEEYGQHFSAFCALLENDGVWAEMFKDWVWLQGGWDRPAILRHLHRSYNDKSHPVLRGLHFSEDDVPHQTRRWLEAKGKSRDRTWQDALRCLRNKLEHEHAWDEQEEFTEALDPFAHSALDALGKALWRRVVEDDES